MPKSTLVERAKVEQGANLGLVDFRDPETRRQGLELFDLSNFTPGLQADTKNAAMQCEQFEQLGQDPNAVQAMAMVLQFADQAAQQAAQMGSPAKPPYDLLVKGCASVGVQIPKIRPNVDAHAVFALELGNWLKSEVAMALPEPVQRVAEWKHGEHQQLFQDAQ